MEEAATPDGSQDLPVLVQDRRSDSASPVFWEPSACCSANALAAYATAYALLMNNYALLPINVSGMFVGDVTQRKEMGGALSVIMMILMVCAIFNQYAITNRSRKGVAR